MDTCGLDHGAHFGEVGIWDNDYMVVSLRGAEAESQLAVFVSGF